jgi:hypothetical protein
VDAVEITVFDLSGKAVHSARLPGPPTGLLNGQYYFDYTWKGPKASGMYFAVIHGKTGQGLVRARAKFAVVR